MAEEIIFKVGVETGNTVNDLNKLEKELEGVDKATKQTAQDMYNLSARFEDIYGDLQPLSSRLGEIEDRMYELALAGKQNTDEFRALQAEVVRYRQTIIETDRSVDLLAEQGRGLGTALQIGGGIVAGYGAVQGAMALVGNESEELQKVMVKLQAVQAVLQSMEQIKLVLDQKTVLVTSLKAGATKALTVAQTVYTTAVGATTGAMKALNVAMMAIPIMAIIAGIIAIVSAVKELSDVTDEAIEANDKLTKSYEQQGQILDELFEKKVSDAKHEIDLMKARGATNEEVHQAELKLLQGQQNGRVLLLKREQEFIRLKRQNYQLFLKAGLEDQAKAIKEEIEQARGKYKELTKLQDTDAKQAELKTVSFNQKEREEQQKNAEKNREAYKKAQEKRRQDIAEAQAKELELQRLLQDLINANIQDENQRELAQLATKHQREREEIVKKYGQNAELIKQLEQKQATETANLIDEQTKERTEKEKDERQKALELQNRDAKAELEARLLRVQEDFMLEQELKAELALMERDQLLQNDQLTAGEREKIQAEYEAKIQALNTETAEHQKKLQQETIANQIAWAEKGAQALQSIGDAVFAIRLRNVEKGSKEEEKIAKKQFQFNKAMQLSGAIIDGAKAVTASLASAPIAIGPLPNPAGIASLAFAVTTSLANIAKIASTQFESKSAGGGAVAPPNIPNPQTITTQQGNTFTDGTNTLTGGLNEQPTKVFVLDSEITAQQSNTAKVVAVSTIQ